MKPMASTLSDDDMRNVAAFYASKAAKPGLSKSPATVELGKKIWRGGIADKQVPSCAGCHGPTGAGVPRNTPAWAASTPSTCGRAGPVPLGQARQQPADDHDRRAHERRRDRGRVRLRRRPERRQVSAGERDGGLPPPFA